MDQGFDSYVYETLYSDKLNERVFGWLEESGEERFFLFINYIDAHRVYNTAPRPGLLETPAVQDKGELLSELVKRVLPAEEPVPAELARKVVDQYDTAIANLDEGFGALLSRLRALDLYDRSLIIVTSDHGEFFGEHRLVEHSKDIYQETLWVPLLIKAPGQGAPESVDTLVSSTDMPYQILSQVPEEVSGKYMKLFPHAPGEQPVISENYYSRAKDLYNPRWGDRFYRVRRAIFDWPYKYIHSSDGQHELFNLETDPLESENLLAVEPEIAARLGRSLEEFMARRLNSVRVMSKDDFPTEEDRELLERLRSLGYVASN
jgi:arylsulfatase A-like enzyme